MAGIWRKLPPLMADNFGFIEVMNQTDGMGIIDDCSEYRTTRERRRGRAGMRVVHTGMNQETIVNGTEEGILRTFQEYKNVYNPQFVLLSNGPCAAMIGTDLEQAAEKIEKEYRIRTGAVKLSGQKKYDGGISETLLAMVKLLVKPQEKEPGSINIIGANRLDWQDANCEGIREWVEAQGLHVIANIGGKETTANMENAAKASWNLVVSVSGIAAAKYMEKEYGTSYRIMAPFGKNSGKKLAETFEKEPEHIGTKDAKKILIIGEQVMGNAIREALRETYTDSQIQVCTFYMFEKSIACPGDRRIRSEEDAEQLLGKEYQIILADPLLKKLARPDANWVDLPHRAFELYGEIQPLPLLLGENLDVWLEKQITV